MNSKSKVPSQRPADARSGASGDLDLGRWRADLGAFTKAQQAAIAARGNLLVVAGAGTGKTRTLVARCLRLVTEENVSLENILMVTFTEAAAAEMRARIRKELRQVQSLQPGNEHLAHQLALLDGARICTLHSFCLQLTREHFHELAIDPQFSVLDEQQTRPLMRATLDDLLERHYDGARPESGAVRALIREVGRGTDRPIRRLVQKIHEYSQSLPAPERWLDEQEKRFAQSEPRAWHEWFVEAVAAWRAEWREPLAAAKDHASAVRLCLEALDAIPEKLSIADAALVLRCVGKADEAIENWPWGTVGRVRDPLKHFFAEADFLRSLLPGADGDPLAQDWEWSRHHLSALLALAREFTAAFTKAKRDLGGLDFADLEQAALRLLKIPGIVAQWRERLHHVFVDEYQDINEAQDSIITALSREGEGNRFLVGDMKQSIYRFRRANPKIFQRCKAAWERDAAVRGRAPGGGGQVVSLADNFRSREALLGFINPLFASVMREVIGGVDYEPLRFGAPEQRDALSSRAGEAPVTELHLVARGHEEMEGDELEEEDAAVRAPAELLAVEREARLAARRLRELKESGHPVWDDEEQRFRPVQWQDMAVLLRSPAGRAEAFAQEFSRAGVPLAAARGGFFESLEISDLINLLRLLDNPLQDIPLLAVLRSPLVGLSLDELAEVRAGSPAKPFWTALMVYQRNAKGRSAWEKADLFHRQFQRWRELARQSSLSHCLESALAETHYEALLLAGPRGEERSANLRRLLDLARQFDPYQRQGLYRFLRFVEAQEDEELDLKAAPAVATADAVQLMSIHRSKGLEFPVVVVACLGTRFNEQDLNQPVLLHERFGVCGRITLPDSEQSYPGLPHWLARRHERRELRGEELRLLYVALTRARDALILVGSVSRKAAALRNTMLEKAGARPLTTGQIVGSNSHLEWLIKWLPSVAPATAWQDQRTGRIEALRWRIYDEKDAAFANEPDHSAPNPKPAAARDDEPERIEKVKAAVEWQYPFAEATTEAAKTSVSILRRRHRDEAEAETGRWFAERVPKRLAARRSGGLSAADIGSAHHWFLQMASLDEVGDEAGLKSECDRLCAAGQLTAEEAAAIDIPALVGFWQSDLGRQILAQRTSVQREIPFTARFSSADLAQAGLAVKLPGKEFVVVQGVADLAVILPKEIWLVDFKTDRLKPDELAARAEHYAPQLKLYALALSRIYRRPVKDCWLYFLSQRSLQAVQPVRERVGFT